MVEGGKGEAGLEAMLTCRCSMGLTACIAQMDYKWFVEIWCIVVFGVLVWYTQLLVANRWTEDEVGAKDAHHVAAILPFRSRSIQQLATVRNMESFAPQPFVARLQQSSIQCVNLSKNPAKQIALQNSRQVSFLLFIAVQQQLGELTRHWIVQAARLWSWPRLWCGLSCRCLIRCQGGVWSHKLLWHTLASSRSFPSARCSLECWRSPRRSLHFMPNKYG